jgi:uncharacterized protein (TIGR02246 family)
MSSNGRILATALAGLAVAVTAGALGRSGAQEPPLPRSGEPAPGKAGGAKMKSPGAAAVRKKTAQFAAAFNRGDARAAAAFWAKDGEYTGPDGNTLHGRKAIEKSYAGFFKKNPKARLEVHPESLRVYGHHAALEEGMLKLRLPDKRQAGRSRYSVLHVRDEDGWHMASVHEWTPDPADLVSLRDLEWLLGEWVAREGGTAVRTRYAWAEGKAFLHVRYTLTADGKVVGSGLQVIGQDPAGGLRAWQFDRSGRFAEQSWSRDGDRWVIESARTLPDGTETHAVNHLIPHGKDAFTWQSAEYAADGSLLSRRPPLKVTRVKATRLARPAKG